MIITTGFTMLAITGIGNEVARRGICNNLAEVIEDNVDEIEFYPDYLSLDMDDDYDLYLEYRGGYLEIDDDFIRTVNGVNSSIYEQNGNMLYGENPVFRETEELSFVNGKVRTVKTQAGKYYVYDRFLDMKGTEDLWLRGTVSAESGMAQIRIVSRLSLLILPLLVAAAVGGGYLFAKRALEPLRNMSESAESIRAGHDLTKRIEIGEGNDELHSLADNFNAMLERLEKSFQAEQQLTGDVSHELRTPVSVIMSQCEFTLEEPRSTEEYEDALRLILRQSRKMSSMIGDMLFFARLERRDDGADLTETDISAVVRSVCEDMALIREREIELQNEIEDGIFAPADAELLSRLTVNLISNAYRYGRDGGNILVTLKRDGENAMLSVRDDGIGIAPEELEKIWNRFYRADASRSKKGTGLGLNFVREIARIHGGTATVESTPGEGSTFTVTLPADKN